MFFTPLYLVKLQDFSTVNISPVRRKIYYKLHILYMCYDLSDLRRLFY